MTKVKLIKETESVQEKPRSGKPRCTTRGQTDRQLVLQAERKRFNSAVVLKRDNTRGVNLQK